MSLAVPKLSISLINSSKYGSLEVDIISAYFHSLGITNDIIVETTNAPIPVAGWGSVQRHIYNGISTIGMTKRRNSIARSQVVITLGPEAKLSHGRTTGNDT